LAKVEVSKDVQEARGEVIKCLKDNKGKSLNCWDEVEAFTKLIKEL
jgi:altered-inheritance-of-mitochondria protein 13